MGPRVQTHGIPSFSHQAAGAKGPSKSPKCSFKQCKYTKIAGFSGYLSLIRLKWTSTTAEFQVSHGAALALGSVHILQQELHLPLPLTPHRIERHIHAATQGATVPIIRGPNLELDQGIWVLSISFFGLETSEPPKNWIWLYTKKKTTKGLVVLYCMTPCLRGKRR